MKRQRCFQFRLGKHSGQRAPRGCDAEYSAIAEARAPCLPINKTCQGCSSSSIRGSVCRAIAAIRRIFSTFSPCLRSHWPASACRCGHGGRQWRYQQLGGGRHANAPIGSRNIMRSGRPGCSARLIRSSASASSALFRDALKSAILRPGIHIVVEPAAGSSAQISAATSPEGAITHAPSPAPEAISTFQPNNRS